MVEDTNSYQFQAARVADIFLCTQEKYVPYNKLLEFLPGVVGVEEIERFQTALKFDELDRFSVKEEGGELSFCLKYFSDADRRIQEGVEWWRVCIAKRMEQFSAPMELSKVALHVERPLLIPRNIKLKDILHADSLNRFRIHGSPNLPLVSLRVSDAEMKELIIQWRANVYMFLYAQRRDFTLTAIGQHVARPGKLSDKQIKLIEVLKSDPEERFFLKFRSPTDTVVRVKLTHQHRTELEEKWRVGVTDFLRQFRHGVSLTELGVNIRRPSIHLGAPTSLRSVLLDDPQVRFALMGSGPGCQVRLAAPGAPLSFRPNSPHTVRFGRPASPIHKSDQSSNLNIVPMTTSELNSFFESFHMSDLDVPDAVGELRNSASFSTVPHIPLALNSRDLLLPLPPQPLLYSGSVLEDFSLSPLSYGSLASVSSELPAAFTVRGASQPSPPGLASGSAVGVIGPPAAAHQPLSPTNSTGKSVTQLFSPPAALPNPALYETSSDSGSSRSASPRSSTDRDTLSARLSEWLPIVLADFPHNLVESAVAHLGKEGFVSVRDLVVARSLGQLSPEYLAQVGLKMGHCNRIFARLPLSAEL